MTILMALVSIVSIISLLFLARYMLAKMSIWTPKRIWLFVAGYVGVGIVAFLYLTFSTTEEKILVSDKEIEAMQLREDEVKEYAANNEWEKIDPAYIKEQRSFLVETKEVELKIDSNVYSPSIYITTSEAATNEIVATYYELPHFVSGIDVTEEILPAEIKFDQAILSLQEQPTELTYYTLKPTLMMIEDNLDGVYSSTNHHRYFIGQRILHLNVPRHIHIIDNSGWAYYLSN